MLLTDSTSTEATVRVFAKKKRRGMSRPFDTPCTLNGDRPKPTGEPLHPSSVSQAFDRLVTRSGLPAIRFHDLRHTHATLALQAGIHPKIVSERLGHSTVTLTLDVYSHLNPDMDQDAAQKIADTFRRKRASE